MLRIVRDLLDQQIIDALGRKVVRVNDVTFEIRHDGDYYYLNVLEVDIGVRSIVRRLLQGVSRLRSCANCNGEFSRIPFAGSTATSSKPTRSGGCD